MAITLVGLNSTFAQTWIQASELTNLLWTSVASSANGSNLVAASTTGIFISSDSGMTWVSNNLAAQAVASSADGTKLTAVQNYGGIYVSTNSGVTWQPTTAPNSQWDSVASSADGTKLAAACFYIYTSSNSGATKYEQLH